jgi:DNA polymerase elongation subunit (family B)
MSRVVLDIETLGYPLEAFDAAQQEYLLKFSGTDVEREEAVSKFSLFPLTAQIIAVGMLNPDTKKGKVLFQSDTPVSQTDEDGAVHFQSGSEKEILESFWTDIIHYDRFITFNGRSFDCPFLLLRSALQSVKPTRNLMPYRYDSAVHCDLLEQLTFYGAMRKFNLDFYCKEFGIQSPKESGIKGTDMQALFDEKRFLDIARYNLGDLKATAELFLRWEKYLTF